MQYWSTLSILWYIQFHEKQSWWTIAQEGETTCSLLACQPDLVLGITVLNKPVHYICGNYIEKVMQIRLKLLIFALGYPVCNLSLTVPNLKFSAWSMTLLFHLIFINKKYDTLKISHFLKPVPSLILHFL